MEEAKDAEHADDEATSEERDTEAATPIGTEQWEELEEATEPCESLKEAKYSVDAEETECAEYTIESESPLLLSLSSITLHSESVCWYTS